MANEKFCGWVSKKASQYYDQWLGHHLVSQIDQCSCAFSFSILCVHHLYFPLLREWQVLCLDCWLSETGILLIVLKPFTQQLVSWIVYLVINSVQLNYWEVGNISLSIGNVPCLLADFLLLKRLGKSEVDLDHLLITLWPKISADVSPFKQAYAQFEEFLVVAGFLHGRAGTFSLLWVLSWIMGWMAHTVCWNYAVNL